MILKENIRWHKAFKILWKLNRVHVSKETSDAYKLFKKIYDKIKIISVDYKKKCGDWEVPPGWSVIKATVKDPKGKSLIDWKKNKLSLWTYSPSFVGKLSLDKFKSKILFDKKRPNASIFHFRNQYNFWKTEWGVSLPYKKYKKLKKGLYDINIKTKFYNHNLDLAEQVHKGKKKNSIIFVSHFDHPQMCVDGLSGCILGHEVLSNIKYKTKLTYRMISTPEIVGSVFYSNFYKKRNKIEEALFIATPGANQELSYQNSSNGNSYIDIYVRHLLKYYTKKKKIYNFRKGPIGNDEIAFDTKGTNIPCGSIMRSPFKEYHTDQDNIQAINEKNFEETFNFINDLIFIFENNSYIYGNFESLPRFSNKDYDLYLSPSNVSGINSDKYNLLHNLITKNITPKIKKKLNFKNFNYLMNLIPIMSEGKHTVLDIAEKSDLPFSFVYNYLNLCSKKKILNLKWKYPFKKN